MKQEAVVPAPPRSADEQDARTERNKAYADWRKSSAYVPSDGGAFIAGYEIGQREVEDQQITLDKLASLLRGVCDALKGKPPEDTAYSWHDLPKLAAAAEQDARRYRYLRSAKTDCGSLYTNIGDYDIEVLALKCDDELDAAIDAAMGDTHAG